MTESKIEIITAVMKAFGRQDIDSAMSRIAPDVEWHYHVGTRPVIGHDNMRKVLTKLGGHQLDSQWRSLRWAETGSTLMIEGIEDYGTAEGRRVQVPYMGVYEFNDDDLITGWRDYFDLELMMKSDRGEPMDVWVQALIDAEPG